jgi:ribosome maturation factor RimP
MDFAENIKQLAHPLLTEDQFIVSVAVSGIQAPQKVTIALDGDKGVTIDDCASLSRQLLDVLETQGLVGENFTLEVTTPGTDRPLKLNRQYVKNIGRGLKLHLSNKTIVEGKLTEVSSEHITLEQEVGTGKKMEVKKTTLGFPEIEKAFVQISFK